MGRRFIDGNLLKNLRFSDEFSTKRKHKKVEQALGRSLRNLFEQLAWRTSPAAVLQVDIVRHLVLIPIDRLLVQHLRGTVHTQTDGH